MLGKVRDNGKDIRAAAIAASLAKSIPLIANFKRSKKVIAIVNDTVIIVKVLTILFNWLTIKFRCWIILSIVSWLAHASATIYFYI